MKYNKHIIFFTPGFPHNEEETDCIPAMQNFVKGFKENHSDVKISVISFFYPLKKRHYLWNGVNVYSIGSSSFKIISWLKVYLTFKKIYKPQQETIVQSFWLNHCALVGHWIHSLFEVKHFCMVMGQDVSFKNKFRYILPKKRLVIVCPNELSNQKLKTVFKREANYIIPRGIDSESFKNKNITKDIDILGVGNLSELKNYSSFLRIIAVLKTKIKSIKVVIIGKGAELFLLNNFIKENDLENNVSIIGHIQRKEVLEVMMQSKILLHTSNFEDESYAITEALYANMYAVGFEKVLNKRENLVLGNTENELTKICFDLLENYKKPVSNKIYTINEMTNDFRKIYFSQKE